MLTITGGNNQIGQQGAYLSEPLSVEVRNSANNALLPNAPVVFAVTAGGGGLAEQSGSETASGTLNVPTGNETSNGIVQAWFQATQVGAANTITAQAGSSDPLTFTETVLGSDRLVGRWNFDGGTGGTVADSSPLGHDGTLTNSPQWSERYTGEGCITFSGPVAAGGSDDCGKGVSSPCMWCASTANNNQ